VQTIIDSVTAGSLKREKHFEFQNLIQPGLKNQSKDRGKI